MSLQREKILQAGEIAKEEKIDCWMTIGRETVMNSDPVIPLISSHDFGSLTAVMVFKSGKHLCLTGHLDGNGMKQSKVYDEVVVYDKSFFEAFKTIMEEQKVETLALNYSEDVSCDGLTHGLYLKVMSFLDALNYKGKVISSESIVKKLRSRKTQEELVAIKKAINYTETILNEAKDFIKPGVTEKEIHRFCQDRIEFYGVENAWDVQHNPGVMVGPNTVFGHAGPTDLPVEEGHLITLDFGTKVNGYCSDIQRVYYVLKEGETEAPQKYQNALKEIHKAVDQGMNNMVVGNAGFEPDEAARAYIASKNLPDFNFAFGHQVGRETHDGGVLMGPKWERYLGLVEGPLEDQSVYTVDINIGFEDGHMGQEDMAYLTNDGVSFLSKRQHTIYLCNR